MTTRPTLTVGLPNFGSWFRDLRSLVDTASELDGAGVDRIVVVDHLVMGPHPEDYPWGTFPTASDGDWYEPLTTLAAVAGATERIRLSTGILVAALRPAAVLAKTVATIDAVSGGRVDLGVGVGWQREEFEAVGLDFDQRGALLDDTVGACRALWEQSSASFSSPSVSFTDTWCHPQPTQARLPVLFSGTLGTRNLRRITTLGDGWIPIMGATREHIADGCARLDEAWTAAGREGRPQVRVPLTPKKNASGTFDRSATAEQVPELVTLGATEVSISAQSLASPGDCDGLIEQAGALAASLRDAESWEWAR